MYVCCYAELQLNVSGEQKWLLARTTDLTSYRNLERLKVENKVKEDELWELRRMKSVFSGLLHENKTQRQQLMEKEQQLTEKAQQLVDKELQLQSELEATKCMSQAKSQKILKLEEKLQAKWKAVAFLTDQFEQLKQQGKDAMRKRVTKAYC